MAKQSIAVKENSTTTMTPAELEELKKAMEDDAGAGISNRPEDNIVPQLKWLQPLSPEVIQGPGRVEGAAPGDFLLGGKVVKSEEGIWFQPCWEENKLFEFTPLERGGGFVAEHEMARDDKGRAIFDRSGDPILPDGAVKTDKFRYGFANGNQLMHYRQLAGIAWYNGKGLPFVISFKSTGHTTMREWMTAAGRANQFPDGRQRAIYSHIYKLHTSARRNAKGQWFVLDVGEPVCLDPDIDKNVVNIIENPHRAFLMGRALCNAFKAREQVAESIATDRDLSGNGDSDSDSDTL